eukprot:359980-Chlamydomonas_euryale.AAC.4
MLELCLDSQTRLGAALPCPLVFGSDLGVLDPGVHHLHAHLRPGLHTMQHGTMRACTGRMASNLLLVAVHTCSPSALPDRPHLLNFHSSSSTPHHSQQTSHGGGRRASVAGKSISAILYAICMPFVCDLYAICMPKRAVCGLRPLAARVEWDV